MELFGRRRHDERVRRCADLSAVNLRCHPHTWGFALRAMSGPWLDGHGRWAEDRSDAITDTGDGLVDVRLSGAKLAELMSILRYIPNRRRRWGGAPVGMEGAFSAAATPAEEEQATRLYDAIAVVVDRVELNTPRSGDFPIIIIDDATADQ